MWIDELQTELEGRDLEIYQGINVSVEDYTRFMGPMLARRRTAEPGLAQKAVTFSQAVVKHVKNGFKTVDDSTMNKRITLCQACDYFDGSKCRKCGCKAKYKTAWESESCPIGKW